MEHAGWDRRRIGGPAARRDGVELASLGGSPYYALAGAALLAVGRREGFWIYLLLFAATIGWALREVGLSFWPLVARLVAPAVLALPVMLIAPRLSGRGPGPTWHLARGLRSRLRSAPRQKWTMRSSVVLPNPLVLSVSSESALVSAKTMFMPGVKLTALKVPESDQIRLIMRPPGRLIALQHALLNSDDMAGEQNGQRAGETIEGSTRSSCRTRSHHEDTVSLKRKDSISSAATPAVECSTGRYLFGNADIGLFLEDVADDKKVGDDAKPRRFASFVRAAAACQFVQLREDFVTRQSATLASAYR